MSGITGQRKVQRNGAGSARRRGRAPARQRRDSPDAVARASVRTLQQDGDGAHTPSPEFGADVVRQGRFYRTVQRRRRLRLSLCHDMGTGAEGLYFLYSRTTERNICVLYRVRLPA